MMKEFKDALPGGAVPGRGHWPGWLCKVKTRFITRGQEQGDTRLTLQTCPIRHGPVRNLPEFPLLSKGRPPGSAESAQGINYTTGAIRFKQLPSPAPPPCGGG